MATLSDKLKQAALTLKIAIPVLGVTGLVQLIGLSTNYWSKAGSGGFKINNGLWKFCGCSLSYCYCTSTSNVQSWLHGVRACEVIGFLGVGLCLLLSLALFFKPLRVLKILAALCIFGSGLLIVLGVIIYASKSSHGLHFSFGLCCLAGALCGAVFILLLLARIDVTTTRAPATSQPVAQYQKGGYVVTPPAAQGAGGQHPQNI